MENGIYCVRDLAANSFLAPFMAVSDEVALRQFAFAFKDDRSIMAANPGDFELFRIADFNQESGRIDPVDKIMIARGTDYAV